MLKLSVLDQSVVSKGRPQDESIRNTLALAQLCEDWGYERFWVSEHHSLASIAGTAPEVLLAAIAARTQRIRLGSAGVMLPHYSALKVAEQFRVLDALVCDSEAEAARQFQTRARWRMDRNKGLAGPLLSPEEAVVGLSAAQLQRA